MEALRTAGALVCSLACVALSPELAAQPPGRSSPGTTQSWLERLERAEAALRQEEYKKAKRSLDWLLEEMCGRMEGGEEAGSLLGTAVAYRAIAEAGRGKTRDSAWDWWMARSLQSGPTHPDLALYGEAGRIVASFESERPDEGEGRTRDEIGDEVTPPKTVRTPFPKYPRAKRRACLAAPVELDFIIGKDGLLHEPRLLTRDEAVLGFAAMDKFREWRFEPARVGGEPVRVLYSATVTFGMTVCENPLAWRSD